MHQKILIIDFGSQYTQLIARKIRELNVYCEIHSYNNIPIRNDNIKGVILSGSPFSVLDKNAPIVNMKKYRNKIPILGICYGAQLLAYFENCKIEKSKVREYGRAILTTVNNNYDLFKDILPGSQVWMSHGDTIIELNDKFEILASTEDVKVAAYKIKNEETYGIQFHPEVYHSENGKIVLENFVKKICNCNLDWTPKNFISETINNLKNTIKDEKVILGLSGGVDSTVTAVLLNKAIGKNLYCIFVNNGLLRKNEFENVLRKYKEMNLNVNPVDASEIFLSKLKNIFDPEEKRKIIGETFIDIFNKEASKIKDVKFLAQGTIYPDLIESKSVKGPSSTIKSHHNVGALPEKMNLKVIEPLRLLFKDEVRQIGKELGINDDLLRRHPFPGPGLAIRIIGEVTKEKINILQEVDNIFIEGLKENALYDKVWQAAAILLPVRSVGVMGDERTYENVVALRAVTSTDGMTADWCNLPYDFLKKISNNIINKVKGVNRVVYDISSKPPSTIEWE